jgi:RimJ/RimL family protein N-acetyltransferase
MEDAASSREDEAAAVSVPTVSTARLTFRGHRRDDLAELAAMWGSTEVTRHIGGRPFSEEEVWTKLLRNVGHWAVMGFGYWVVEEKASGRFVGEVGLADLRREIEPALDGTPEIGWVLAPWAHGRGYATEAARAAIAWAETHLGSRRTVCLIDPENRASIRVAEKCGYVELVRTTYKMQPTILFERP